MGLEPVKRRRRSPMGWGRSTFPITTRSPQAQAYFTQGLGFAYGFNHAAAIASFREAQRIDPTCALCWWGEAMAHGPNINAPMDPAANARAVGAARYADWLARKGEPGRAGADRGDAQALFARCQGRPRWRSMRLMPMRC